MRTLFLFLTLSLVCNFLLAAAPSEKIALALKEATAELSSIKAERAQFAEKYSSEKFELLKRLESLRKEKSTLLKEIDNLENERTQLMGSEIQLKYYSQISSDIFSNALTFRKSFLNEEGSVKFKMPVGDSANFAKEVLEKAFARVFNPLEPYSGSLIFASGDIVSGKFFRIGGAKYFYSEDGEHAGFVSKNEKLYGESFAKEILSFKDGKTRKIPMDISEGKFERSEAGRMKIVEQIKLGGVWMYPILFFGAISSVVFLCKLFSYFRMRRADAKILRPIFAKLTLNDENAALNLAKNAGSPYSNLLSGLISSRNLGASTLEEISYEYMLSSGEKLFHGLGVLSVTAAVAPLFGLLGTVTGIIKTFADISVRAHGAADAGIVSTGISEALITTEYGLIVAIPAFVAHALLSRRARAVMSDMEKISSAFISKIQAEKE